MLSAFVLAASAVACTPTVIDGSTTTTTGQGGTGSVDAPYGGGMPEPWGAGGSETGGAPDPWGTGGAGGAATITTEGSGGAGFDGDMAEGWGGGK